MLELFWLASPTTEPHWQLRFICCNGEMLEGNSVFHQASQEWVQHGNIQPSHSGFHTGVFQGSPIPWCCHVVWWRLIPPIHPALQHVPLLSCNLRVPGRHLSDILAPGQILPAARATLTREFARTSDTAISLQLSSSDQFFLPSEYSSNGLWGVEGFSSERKQLVS